MAGSPHKKGPDGKPVGTPAVAAGGAVVVVEFTTPPATPGDANPTAIEVVATAAANRFMDAQTRTRRHGMPADPPENFGVRSAVRRARR